MRDGAIRIGERLAIAAVVVGEAVIVGVRVRGACEAAGGVQKKAEDRLFGDRCRVIAGGDPSGDTDRRVATDGPGNPTDNNGRSADIETTHPVLATDTGPGSPGDDTGRSQKTAGDTGPGSPGDDTSRSHASMESDGYPVLATEGPPSGPGDNNGRSQASNTNDGRLLILTASRPSSGGEINL